MPLARLVTVLQPHLAEPMTTHEFIDEDAHLACQDLSDWQKQFFADIGDKTSENNGNESHKETEEYMVCIWSGLGEVLPARTSPTLHPPFPLTAL